MDEKENVGFEDFESALFGDDYQFGDEDGEYEDTETDGAEDDSVSDDDVEETDADEVDDQEPAEDDEDEFDDEESEEEGEDNGEEDNSAGDAEQTFTLKVNKEERQVTLEEMTALAQKGADYDRVKEQNAKSQQTIKDLQTQLEGFNGQKSVLDTLSIVSEKCGTSLDQLAENLYVSLRKSQGASEETAREELKSARLEKELNGMKAQQAQVKQKPDDAESRAQREMEEFKQNFPDVSLTEELVDKLLPDIQKGMSLSGAYRKMEKAQDAAKIKELEQQLAAKKQNAANKKRSPGSQKDSGGRRSKSDYEDFERALFG